MAIKTIRLPADRLSVIPGPPAQQGTIQWNGDFQTGDFSQYWGTQFQVASRGTVVASPVGDGKLWARIQLNTGDVPSGTGSDGNRTQFDIGTVNAQGNNNPAYGLQQWWSWSWYFPNGYTGPGSMAGGDFFNLVAQPLPDWNIPFQFQHATAVNQGMFNFFIGMGDNPVSLGVNHYYGDQNNPTQDRLIMDTAFSLATRYDFVFNVTWQKDNTGSFFVWMKKGSGEAAKVLSFANSPTLYATSSGVALTNEKLFPAGGLYHYKITQTDVVYHTGYCWGNSYSAVISKFPKNSWPATAP